MFLLDSYKHNCTSALHEKRLAKLQGSFPTESPLALPLQDLCLMDVFVFLLGENTIILFEVKSNNWYRRDILECE